MLNTNKILENLCYYDERNPNNDNDLNEFTKEELENKRKHCSCDNCYYGRTQLAEEILRLQSIIEKEK